MASHFIDIGERFVFRGLEDTSELISRLLYVESDGEILGTWYYFVYSSKSVLIAV